MGTCSKARLEQSDSGTGPSGQAWLVMTDQRVIKEILKFC